MLKFPEVPCGASCPRLSMRGAEGAAPVALALGALQQGWEAALGLGTQGCLCRVSPAAPQLARPLLPQMSKVWNDLQPKLRCLFVGLPGTPAPPRPPQDGLSAH